jgi:hypothetical protein
MKNIILILTIVLMQNIFATGGTYCSLQNEKLNIDVSISNSRMAGAPVLSANVSIKELQTSLNEMTLSKNELVGWWSQSGELRMHFLSPAVDDDKNDTQLIITTVFSEKDGFMGNMTYISPQGKEYVETISCELE